MKSQALFTTNRVSGTVTNNSVRHSNWHLIADCAQRVQETLSLRYGSDHVSPGSLAHVARGAPMTCSANTIHLVCRAREPRCKQSTNSCPQLESALNLRRKKFHSNASTENPLNPLGHFVSARCQCRARSSTRRTHVREFPFGDQMSQPRRAHKKDQKLSHRWNRWRNLPENIYQCSVAERDNRATAKLPTVPSSRCRLFITTCDKSWHDTFSRPGHG